MFPRLKSTLILFALVLPATLYAGDYTYQQTTQITGGSLLQMVKTVGVFSSQARHMGDPVVSTIYLKDNRLATSRRRILRSSIWTQKPSPRSSPEKDIYCDDFRADEAGH